MTKKSLRAPNNPVSRFSLYQPKHAKNRWMHIKMIYIKQIENIPQKAAAELWILASDSEEKKKCGQGCMTNLLPIKE